MNQLSPSRIVCAALRSPKGIICGPRHYDNTMRLQFEAAGWNYDEDKCEQGFIDQHGKFLTREEAHVIAVANGQIFRRCGGDEHKLFSENLY